MPFQYNWNNFEVAAMEFVYELHWISDFRILNQPCLSWVKSTWSYCIIFLMCFWIQFASFCVEFLHLCSSKKWFCNFFLPSFLFLSFFFLYTYMVLVSRWYWMSLVVIPSCSTLWNILRRTGLRFSLKVERTWQWTCLGLGSSSREGF